VDAVRDALNDEARELTDHAAVELATASQTRGRLVHGFGRGRD